MACCFLLLLGVEEVVDIDCIATFNYYLRRGILFLCDSVASLRLRAIAVLERHTCNRVDLLQNEVRRLDIWCRCRRLPIVSWHLLTCWHQSFLFVSRSFVFYNVITHDFTTPSFYFTCTYLQRFNLHNHDHCKQLQTPLLLSYFCYGCFSQRTLSIT